VTFNLIRIILHWIHHRNTEHSENDVITVPHHWSGRQQKYCTSWNVPLPRKYIGILSLSQCHWNRRQISTSQHHASASYTSYCKTQSQKHTGMRHNLNDSHITPKWHLYDTCMTSVWKWKLYDSSSVWHLYCSQVITQFHLQPARTQSHKGAYLGGSPCIYPSLPLCRWIFLVKYF